MEPKSKTTAREMTENIKLVLKGFFILLFIIMVGKFIIKLFQNEEELMVSPVFFTIVVAYLCISLLDTSMVKNDKK